jgi:hypothetical protein
MSQWKKRKRLGPGVGVRDAACVSEGGGEDEDEVFRR